MKGEDLLSSHLSLMEDFMKRIVFLSLVLLLSACSSPQVYKDVFNKDGGPNVRTFKASVDTCYLAVSRAVLSQNFRIEKEDSQAKTAMEEEKTVTDEEFYKKFFEAVEKEIKVLAGELRH